MVDKQKSYLIQTKFDPENWIIKPCRKLLGLMINKCFLNTQIGNPPAMQACIFFGLSNPVVNSLV